MGRAEDLYARLIADGLGAIDAMIQDRVSEELFLDFKRSADNGAGAKLHQSDRNNLGRAVSGFGNSEGGMIVWGVECKSQAGAGDVASAKIPIMDPKRFVSWLTGAVSGCTVPAHPGVQHSVIHESNNEGFVATLIPKSYLAPHQCISPLHYYMRAGSDFLPVPHAVLLGMFGRRPQPDILHMWAVGSFQVIPVVGPPQAISFEAAFLLNTHGPGLVRDIFVTAELGPPGGKSELKYGFKDTANWSGNKAFGYRFSIVSNDAFKLAPGAIISPFFLSFRLHPPFLEPLHLIFSYGHRDSPTIRVEHIVSPHDLQVAYDLYFATKTTDAEQAFMTAVTGGKTKPPQ